MNAPLHTRTLYKPFSSLTHAVCAPTHSYLRAVYMLTHIYTRAICTFSLLHIHKVYTHAHTHTPTQYIHSPSQKRACNIHPHSVHASPTRRIRTQNASSAHIHKYAQFKSLYLQHKAYPGRHRSTYTKFPRPHTRSTQSTPRPPPFTEFGTLARRRRPRGRRAFHRRPRRNGAGAAKASAAVPLAEDAKGAQYLMLFVVLFIRQRSKCFR